MYLTTFKYMSSMSDILIASPTMNKTTNDIWRYSVITTSLQTDRTLGFIMNQSVLNIDYKQISKIYGLQHILPRCTVYCGGPIHTEKATIIHSPDWRNNRTQIFNKQSCLTFDDHIVRDISLGKGPQHWKVMLGYSEWLDGQMDAEIIRPGGWLVQQWDNIVWSKYKRKEKMWNRILEKQSTISSNNFLDQIFDQ